MFVLPIYTVPYYPQINLVTKHSKKEFSSFCTDNGVLLCEKDGGSFLTLRYTEDLEALKALLNKIEVKNGY